MESGGKKAEAARIFQVSRATIYNWLSRDSLEPTLRVPSERKLNKEALIEHVKAYPDALQRERAVHFGVCDTTISAALRKLGIGKKRSATLRDVQKSVLLG
ncbi:IS630 transposase-related protein [Magnetococcus sp. PR-3]|uniref:IS630 transposase-related protein n=1 Tax=Magnetococcus sp. PR-3 TaxID=3120355 RepID=UPI003FA6090E